MLTWILFHLLGEQLSGEQLYYTRENHTNTVVGSPYPLEGGGGVSLKKLGEIEYLVHSGPLFHQNEIS